MRVTVRVHQQPPDIVGMHVLEPGVQTILDFVIGKPERPFQPRIDPDLARRQRPVPHADRCRDRGECVAPFALQQSLGRIPAFGDIEAGPDIPLERAIGRESRDPRIHYPAVFAVGALHPILHVKRLTAIE